MYRDDERLRILVLRVGLARCKRCLQLLREERDLILPDLRIAQNAGGFAGVRLQSDDAGEGRRQNEVHAWLRHG